MAGINEFTKLLIHCDGSDGSTTFTDDSPSSHSITAVGDAQVDTAQSVFGGASALFDGNADRLSISDSPDFFLDTNDFTIDFRVRWNGSVTDAGFLGQSNGGGTNLKWGLYYGAISSGKFTLHMQNPAGTPHNIEFTWSPSADTWYHLALVRDGSSWYFFVDGVQTGGTQTDSTSVPNVSSDLRIGADGEAFGQLDGWMDEVRIQNGEAVWTSNFTPPSQAYKEESLWEISESVILNESSTINETVFRINETVDINDSNIFTETIFRINESINVNDSETFSTVQEAKFATKIISINPLIFVTNETPARVVEVDISDPNNPVHTVYNLATGSNAVDVFYNTTTEHIYIACANGLVVKADINNLNTQEVIDLSDSDNILTVEGSNDFGITYAGTNNSVGEMYLIDEREVETIETDLHLLQQNTTILETDFSLIFGKTIETDLHLLSEQTVTLQTNLVLLDSAYNEIEPIERLDIRVFLDNVEVSNHDVDLRNININHTVDLEESTATLKFTRQHDNLDVDLDGNNRPITNQNALRIEIDGNVEFDGNISNLNCIYDRSTDQVDVTAKGSLKEVNYKNITLSLAGVDEDTSLFQVYVQNPQIDNPVLDATKQNPIGFKGIRVNLGDIVHQSLIRTVGGGEGTSLADQIIEGNINGGHPKQNWTYFWFVRAGLIRPSISVIENKTSNDGGNDLQNGFFPEINFPKNQFPTFDFTQYAPQFTDFIARLDIYRYIGTSLQGLASDLWRLIAAQFKYQRIFPDIINPGIIIDEFKSTGQSSFSLTDTPTGGFDSIEEVNINGKPLRKDEYTYSSNSVTIVGGTNSGDRVNIQYGTNDYFLGEAPFQTIATNNGRFIPKERWEDKADGFYKVKDEGNDYIKFAKEVAALEYEKLQNINNQVFPKTSCTMNISLDAYYHYNISLLTRINVDNTTNPNAFRNNNGFPVSVKSININSFDGVLGVTLTCDNQKSNTELEKIDGRFPDEKSSDYLFEGYERKVYSKFNMANRRETE